MPSLTPVSETSETLSPLSEGTETLAAVAEGAETLTTLAELTDESTTHLGFFPGSAPAVAPYPFPSSTSYPGDTYTTGGAGLTLTTLAEGVETLTALAES